ncbi:uncharacterized protein [Elaeis guineensis]|uniref:Uncharacterized protein LOC105042899 isoform X2 n=1 Tax=Elaeis guineensis var. tenera TaxID=51953 RepID=A0A6I9R2M0_ELAGV|nr:uncharacterized protein LOC105042899 isoform X2 [Elaeis guineensis]
MASQCWPSKSNRSSIRYWWVPLEVQSFEPNTFFLKEDVSIPHPKSNAQSETKVPRNRVSTAKFISAVAGIWDYVGQPAMFHANRSLKCRDICQKDNLICYSDGQRMHESRSTNDESFCNNLTSSSCFSTPAKSNFEDLKTIKKRLLFASCNRNVSNSFICKNVQIGDSHLPVDSHGIDKVASLEVSNDLANPYESTTRKNVRTEATSNGSDGTYDNCTIAERNSLADFRANWSEGGNITSECGDVSSDKVVNLVENVLQTHGSLYSTYPLQPLKTTKEAIIVLRNPSSGLQFDCNMDLLSPTNCTLGQCQQETDSSCAVIESSGEISASKDCNIHDNSKKLHDKLVHEQESSLKHWLSIQDKIQNAFSKNRHAIAGALAGTLVSLCLHPVDTVKTIIQANGMGQISSYLIVRRIISEKGILGLYRGIASNIASSAPISAIYTFTYESVKGALLPHLPKEYHSLAHCIAGGCSSIATSFVFTPSERIKQQMQVGLQYQNCWNAMIGCLEKGGMSSLYAGWSAVLCRNIPHSIIKFYTYESLKQLLLASAKPDASLNTLQTLVCGGLAGSTAALFTTPFDVVKTRLQTQGLDSEVGYVCFSRSHLLCII